MDEYQRSLDQLRARVSQGRLVEELYLNDAWKMLRTELEKMLEGFKEAAVSPKALEDSTLHAATIGGYNAIKSLLGLLDAKVKTGQRSQAELKEAEDNGTQQQSRI